MSSLGKVHYNFHTNGNIQIISKMLLNFPHPKEEKIPLKYSKKIKIILDLTPKLLGSFNFYNSKTIRNFNMTEFGQFGI